MIGKKMTVGDYNKRVSLHRPETTVSEEGIARDQFTEWRKAWAKFIPLFGREYFAAAAVQAENNVRFRLRGRIDGITTDMRLCFQGRMFDIQSVTPDEEENDTQLVCVEVKT